jgi:alpha-L-fucosidase
MKPSLSRHVLALVISCSHWALASEPRTAPRPLAELQRDLVNLRFGMFIHLSPATYLDLPDRIRPDHAPPQQGKDAIEGTSDDLSPALFSPAKLDCGQWAEAARSAGMKFAVLTTKHHDGFCLWPSRYSSYTVAQGCRRDVVGEFAEAFRQRGLKVGLYYSIRDRTARIATGAAHGGVSPAKIQFIKNQLTELLTGYGEIGYIMFDAWGNNWHESPSFSDIPYAEIYHHIKSLQPDCLVLNHSRNRSVSDVPQIELRAKMELPAGADWPAVGGDTVQSAWFWRKDFPTEELRSVEWIVQQNLRPHNDRNVVFLLNCAPNRDGRMDANVVARLAEVGQAWRPPSPLSSPPASWKNWPVPSSAPHFTGTNVARGRPVRCSPGQKLASASAVADGDPNTSVDLTGRGAWLEIDLGAVRPLAGIRIWNRFPAKNVMLEQGLVCFSDQPFASADGASPSGTPPIDPLVLTEAPGYPTAFPVKVSARYIRLVSTASGSVGLGEIEVIAQSK